MSCPTFAVRSPPLQPETRCGQLGARLAKPQNWRGVEQAVLPDLLYRSGAIVNRILDVRPALSQLVLGVSLGQWAMHNTALIRWICRNVNRETDQGKIDELLLLLRAVIQDDLQEVRSRMEFIRQKYSVVFEQSPEVHIPENHD